MSGEKVKRDAMGAVVPDDVDGVNLLESDECPACSSRDGYFENPAGYYHCDSCHSTWAGDPEDASIVHYFDKEVAA